MAAATDRVRHRVHRDFGENSTRVLTLLEGLPEALPGTPQEAERIQAALVLGAVGDLRRFDELIALARVDWRDLLVGAGLADADWREQLNLELR